MSTHHLDEKSGCTVEVYSDMFVRHWELSGCSTESVCHSLDVHICLKACKVTFALHVHTTDESSYVSLGEVLSWVVHYVCTADLTTEMGSARDPTCSSVVSTKWSVADYAYAAGDSHD